MILNEHIWTGKLGNSELVGRLRASADVAELPQSDLGFVAAKART